MLRGRNPGSKAADRRPLMVMLVLYSQIPRDYALFPQDVNKNTPLHVYIIEPSRSSPFGDNWGQRGKGISLPRVPEWVGGT